jgi:MoxR-like ATPase
MLRIDMEYPERAAEAEVLARYGGMEAVAQAALGTVSPIDRTLLPAARVEVERVHVSAALSFYVLDLARVSREHARLALGLSTRGALALLKAARIIAALRGGEFVTPDDVKRAAVWVMAHRLVLTPEAALEGATDVATVHSILGDTPVPR